MSGHSVDGEEQSSSAPARNHTLTHVLYAQEAVGDEKKDSAIIDLYVFKSLENASYGLNKQILQNCRPVQARKHRKHFGKSSNRFSWPLAN